MVVVCVTIPQLQITPISRPSPPLEKMNLQILYHVDNHDSTCVSEIERERERDDKTKQCSLTLPRLHSSYAQKRDCVMPRFVVLSLSLPFQLF